MSMLGNGVWAGGVYVEVGGCVKRLLWMPRQQMMISLTRVVVPVELEDKQTIPGTLECGNPIKLGREKQPQLKQKDPGEEDKC